jgi:electron transport complex protein RnfD
LIYAFGCGFLTALIRRYGSYPEGVSFAIVLMNIVTPLLDKFIIPKTFGKPKKEKKAKEAK